MECIIPRLSIPQFHTRAEVEFLLLAITPTEPTMRNTHFKMLITKFILQSFQFKCQNSVRNQYYVSIMASRFEVYSGDNKAYRIPSVVLRKKYFYTFTNEELN